LKKLSFAVENVEMIQENPDSNFALLALDFFASGDNLHRLYVSEETLLKTADTIKNCPLVWKYDEVLDDVYTHDPDEVPCGFVPESSSVTPRKLEDGRTMLSTIAYVWKRYTGPLLSIFRRDGGEKPVSVEMSVYETKKSEDGGTELTDFRYEAVTILGSFVTPAIPSAMSSVLSFSQIKEEYEEDFEKEFSLSDIIIPNKVKYNAEKGLKFRKEYGGGTSTGLAFAKYLINNKTIPHEKIREIANYFAAHKYGNVNIADVPSSENIDWLLWGGDYAKEWAERMVSRLDDELLTFPYKSKAEVNPAIKGITPPVSLAQANAIARQAESVGSDKEKNGWAIAISSFKKTHHVEDGKWVKNKGSTVKASAPEEDEIVNNKEMIMNKDEEKIVEEFAEEEEKNTETIEEPKEELEEEFSEDASPEKKEEEEEEEEKFEFPLEKMSELFADDDEEEDIKKAKDEFCKDKMSVDYNIVMSGIFAKMSKMAAAIAKMAEENKVYMAENEELKKFKAEIEQQQKKFAIDQTIAELETKVIIPDEDKEEMIEEAEKYTLENIEAWKNYCKAKSFDFAILETKKSDVERVGLPFGNTTQKRNDDLWAS